VIARWSRLVIGGMLTFLLLWVGIQGFLSRGDWVSIACIVGGVLRGGVLLYQLLSKSAEEEE